MNDTILKLIIFVFQFIKTFEEKKDIKKKLTKATK